MDTIYTEALNFDQPLTTLSSRFPQQLQAATKSELASDDIQINTLDLQLQQDHLIETAGPPTFCIAIFFDGRGALSIENGPQLAIEPGMTVVFHAPDSIRGRTLFQQNSHLHCLDLRFSPDYLCSLGVDSLTRLIPMFQQNCSVADVMMLARPTSAKLMTIAQSIMQCDIGGLARNVFLQAKALEALAYVLSEFEQPDMHLAKLSKADQQKVKRAIQLLDQQYQNSWTIANLSKEVGLNERKLKSGFHRLVQSTVHNYLEQARLNAAKQLLQQGDKVIDVALAVGYANPSHFAKRFKQRFAMSPRQWQSDYHPC